MKNIVVLGGGYGGVNIIQNLIEQDLPEDVHFTVIDRNPYHSIKTEFYTIAAGTSADTNVRMDFPEHDKISYILQKSNTLMLKTGKFFSKIAVSLLHTII